MTVSITKRFNLFSNCFPELEGKICKNNYWMFGNPENADSCAKKSLNIVKIWCIFKDCILQYNNVY